MSQSNTYFHHEAINGCNSIDEYRLKVKGCGDSTTAFQFLGDAIPGQAVVIIKKTESELRRCIEWCNLSFGGNYDAPLREMHHQMMGLDGMVVNQSDIDKKLKQIWRHLVGDDWKEMYSRIGNMNIQIKDTAADIVAAKNFIKEASLCLG